MNSICISKYRIAEIFGGENFGRCGKRNAIRQYFTQPNSRFTTVANVSYCNFANTFPRQNPEMIDQPKFYPAKILHYTVSVLNKLAIFYLIGLGIRLVVKSRISACITTFYKFLTKISVYDIAIAILGWG